MVQKAILSVYAVGAERSAMRLSVARVAAESSTEQNLLVIITLSCRLLLAPTSAFPVDASQKSLEGTSTCAIVRLLCCAVCAGPDGTHTLVIPAFHGPASLDCCAYETLFDTIIVNSGHLVRP